MGSGVNAIASTKGKELTWRVTRSSLFNPLLSVTVIEIVWIPVDSVAVEN